MENWITEFMSQFGYFGVFLLIMIENIFPPIPSEVILTFGGFMTTYSDMTRIGVIIAATAGSVIGAMILYSMGLLFDVRRLEKIVDRWGQHFTSYTRKIFIGQMHGSINMARGQYYLSLVPLIRSLISIPAGMSNMNFPLFICSQRLEV